MLRRIWQSLSTFIMSVLLATMVWFVATREQNPPVEADYGRQIPLEVENLAPDTVIFESIPDRVTLRLRAPQSSWDSLTPAKFRAWIDLANLAPGLHDVPVQVEVSDSSVTVVEKRPSTVNLRLEMLAQVQVPISVEVVDTAPLGYLARQPVVKPITATVSGPTSIVNQVTQVVGDVYLRGAKETIDRSVDLSARNLNGDVLSRVTITPLKADVTIPIEQRFGYRDVSVRVVITGEVASGYWINNISVDPSTVTVVGGPSALKSLPGFVETSPVDVSKAVGNITERVALQLPPGVSVVQSDTADNSGASGVQVSIGIAPVEGGQTVERPVTFQGLGESMWAVAHPPQVDVILSGPLPRLQALTLQDVTVIVDLFNLQPGVHKIKPAIVVPESVRVQSVLPDTVEVQIGYNPPPTATAIPTPTVSAPAASPAVTATLALTATTTPALERAVTATPAVTTQH